jgi:hypothetical protein
VSRTSFYITLTRRLIVSLFAVAFRLWFVYDPDNRAAGEACCSLIAGVRTVIGLERGCRFQRLASPFTLLHL